MHGLFQLQTILHETEINGKTTTAGQRLFVFNPFTESIAKPASACGCPDGKYEESLNANRQSIYSITSKQSFTRHLNESNYCRRIWSTDCLLHKVDDQTDNRLNTHCHG